MLIITCGNAERADDAVGLLVAKRLQELCINVKICSGETSDLLEIWNMHENVIVVDCVVTGAAVGTVHVWDASQPVELQSSASTHGLGVGEAIELARAFGCLPPRLRIYGIEGNKFTIGGMVSVEVERAVDEVVTRIANEMRAG